MQNLRVLEVVVGGSMLSVTAVFEEEAINIYIYINKFILSWLVPTDECFWKRLECCG